MAVVAVRHCASYVTRWLTGREGRQVDAMAVRHRVQLAGVDERVARERGRHVTAAALWPGSGALVAQLRHTDGPQASQHRATAPRA